MKTMKVSSSLLYFFVSFAVLVPAFLANIADFDEHWKKQAELAEKAALEAYRPDPEEVNEHLNSHVRKVLETRNSTRRNLGSINDHCEVANPIDSCWRCRADWDTDRKRLADCVLGFGKNTTGGKFGNYYVVTDSSDNDMVNPKPGTLRYGAIQKEPLWIIFARSMVIRLNQELMVASNKTIDGRGAEVHIAYGAGITIQFVQNVIIHGLNIHDINVGSGGLIRDSVDHFGLRTPSDGDGISIFGSSHIWIDHNTMSNCKDGLVDVIEGSTAITISNLELTNHNDVMLFGAHDENTKDTIMQITVAFNHFGQGLVQRMPRCRWGFFHVVNNDYVHWLMYAIGGSQNPTIISQGNRFLAPRDKGAKEVTKREYTPSSVWKKWTWRSEDDLFLNGAYFIQSGNPSRHRGVLSDRKVTVYPERVEMMNILVGYPGALHCQKGQPC